MESDSSSSKTRRPRSKRACLSCWIRKIRCDADRTIPCTNCVSFNCECKFAASKKSKVRVLKQPPINPMQPPTLEASSAYQFTHNLQCPIEQVVYPYHTTTTQHSYKSYPHDSSNLGHDAGAYPRHQPMEPVILYQLSRQCGAKAQNAVENIAANAPNTQCPLPYQYQQRPMSLQLRPQDSFDQTHAVVHSVTTHTQLTTSITLITSSHQLGSSHHISPTQMEQSLSAAKAGIFLRDTTTQQAAEKLSLSPSPSSNRHRSMVICKNRQWNASDIKSDERIYIRERVFTERCLHILQYPRHVCPADQMF